MEHAGPIRLSGGFYPVSWERAGWASAEVAAYTELHGWWERADGTVPCVADRTYTWPAGWQGGRVADM